MPRKKTTKPANVAAEPTREDLLAAIGGELDAVDAALAKRKASTRINLAWQSGNAALEKARVQISKLHDYLELIENPEGEYDHPGADEAIQATFADAPGSIPRWSRAGTFLLWMDYVPLRCEWGGFATQSACVFAADPEAMWFSSRGATHLELRYIEPECVTVADSFRLLLRKHVDLAASKLRMVKLDDEAAEATRKTLELPESEWLRDALKAGPVDPLPLPRHLQAVQQRLFA
jgi:hypothetical protein